MKKSKLGTKKALKLRPIKKLVVELDNVFSKYIRLSNTDENGYGKCITCGHIGYIKEMDCGHFQSRGCMSTRFNEKNCGLQCKRCNAFRGGMQYTFGKEIDKKYGGGTADKLELEAKQSCKRDRNDYSNMIDYYKKEVQALLTKKNFRI